METIVLIPTWKSAVPFMLRVASETKDKSVIAGFALEFAKLGGEAGELYVKFLDHKKNDIERQKFKKRLMEIAAEADKA